MNDKRKTVLLWMGILQMANGQSAIGKAKQIVRSFSTWSESSPG
jgi:hypothetical protein